MSLAAAAEAVAKSMVGLASFYGHAHQGKRMANGQRFDDQRLTAAHRHLPFGTRVKVINLRSRKSVIVTITDRGPVRRSRIIDLSAAAARTLGMLARGTDHVSIEVLP